MKRICTSLIIASLVLVLAARSASAQSQDIVKTPAAKAGSEPVAASPDYRLGAGDKLRVEVYKHPEISQALQIRPDGKITLPLIGDVIGAGLTPIELRDRLAAALKQYVTNPVITVIVVETIPAMAYVMGEVNRPGSIPLRGPVSVLQALAEAGGFREFASVKDVRILRRNGTNAHVESIPFNYKDAVKGKKAMIYLRPGDMVVVP